MNPLDFIEKLYYIGHVVNGFIGDIFVTILAIVFITAILLLFFRIVWSIIKFICKPLILVILAIAAVFTFGA
jgi:hypothetical protein